MTPEQEREIYEKYGSAEYRARVQRECAGLNCPAWVSSPDDDYCDEHKPGKYEVSDETRRVVAETDVEAGDSVEYDGHEWRVEWGPHHLVNLERLDPDDPAQNITDRGVDVRDVTPLQ